MALPTYNKAKRRKSFKLLPKGAGVDTADAESLLSKQHT